MFCHFFTFEFFVGTVFLTVIMLAMVVYKDYGQKLDIDFSQKLGMMNLKKSVYMKGSTAYREIGW